LRTTAGWNNRTFFGSDRGGRTAAVLRCFVASRELVKIDPFAWFHDVLSRIVAHPMNRLEELLPHRWAEGSGVVLFSSYKRAGNAVFMGWLLESC